MTKSLDTIDRNIQQLVRRYASSAMESVAHDLEQKYFNIDTETTTDVEFASAHGCAGTGQQHAICEKISIFSDYIKKYYAQKYVDRSQTFSTSSSSSSSSLERAALENPSPFVDSSMGSSHGQMIHFLLGDNAYEHGCASPDGDTLKSLFHDIYAYPNNRIDEYRNHFPWTRIFAILGNHDYNYISPALRYLLYLKNNPSRWPVISNSDNFGLAYNQISQSYQLFAQYPEYYKTPLLPSRYYIVETQFVIYFCLDTNVLLFDENQQQWLTERVREISENHVAREKFFVLVTHQPLQTFGKRGVGNGSAGYYLKNLSAHKKFSGTLTQSQVIRLIETLFPLNALIPDYDYRTPYERIIKMLPPYSLLVRRYLERVFFRHQLKFSMVISAHDHFNEVSLFGPEIVQVIAGVMGLEKDSQNDEHMASYIANLKQKKSTDIAIAKSLQTIREASFGFSDLEFSTFAGLDPTPTAMFRDTPIIEERLTSTEEWRALNSFIRLQVTLPLFKITARNIDIIWQMPDMQTQHKYLSSGRGGGALPIEYEITRKVKIHFSKPISIAKVQYSEMRQDIFLKLVKKIENRGDILHNLLLNPLATSKFAKVQSFFKRSKDVQSLADVTATLHTDLLKVCTSIVIFCSHAHDSQMLLSGHLLAMSDTIKTAMSLLCDIKNKNNFSEHKNVLLDLWCLVESLKDLMAIE